jgi:hypothetical protein
VAGSEGGVVGLAGADVVGVVTLGSEEGATGLGTGVEGERVGTGVGLVERLAGGRDVA